MRYAVFAEKVAVLIGQDEAILAMSEQNLTSRSKAALAGAKLRAHERIAHNRALLMPPDEEPGDA